MFIPINNSERLSAVLQKGLDAPEDSIEDDFDSGKTLVIMLHGFPGHKSAQNDIFGDLEFQVAQDGFHSLRFDFRGCGESEGKSENFTIASACEDMEHVHKWARSFGYDSFFYVGEGLGALLALIRPLEGLRGIVMLWPSLDPRHTALKEALSGLDDPVAREKGYVAWRNTKIGLPFLGELKKYNPTRRLKNLRIPLLIQHGANDRDIPVSQLALLRRYATSHRRIEVTTYEGGEAGLPRMSERQTMFYHVRQFLKRYS